MSDRTPAPRAAGNRGAFTIAAAVLAAGSVSLLGLYAVELRKAQRGPAASIPTLIPKPAPAPGADPAADKLLDEKITLSFDGRAIATTWRELGFQLDPLVGGARPLGANRPLVLERLVGLKDQHDRPAEDARVDLAHRKVIPEVDGFGLHVYESLGRLEEAARAGTTSLELPGGPIHPRLTRATLGNLDVTHVMGWFETKFPPGEKDRNYNLKVAAEKLNGFILMPGQEFSFNAVVGDRTEKEGYRVAHVITAGEMVDGLAGGTCQISTTLHGAVWFAGLDIVYGIPHSRPSAYVTMGMDATVVYPTTDLKLRNPYEFPVVIRYTVSQGTARVEVLGHKRPWTKIAFEREILVEKPYETITREDDELPVGTMIVDQVGFPGYELKRRRLFYRGAKVAKKEERLIKYPPTTEYVRIGSNPNPNLVPPPATKPHGLTKPPDKPGKPWVLEQ